MGSLKRMFLVAATALAATTVAQAADLDPPVIPAPELIPQKLGGWYLRGDIGVDFFTDPDVRFHALEFEHEELRPALMVGVGAGYEFNQYLRADLTVDYRGTDFNGKTPCYAACGFAFTQENAELNIFTGMANIYLQAGTYYGFTPYIGGGIGFAYVDLSEYAGFNPNGTTNTFNDNDATNFAWNVTAGASYAFSERLALDANYRYLDFGDISTGGDPAGNFAGSVDIEDITAHEVRVGLRYYLN